jgi:hypothetical protein
LWESVPVRSANCARAKAKRVVLTHRKKIHMLTRRRSELVTVRISLVDAMAASQIS